jgi:hypothetical protein
VHFSAQRGTEGPAAGLWPARRGASFALPRSRTRPEQSSSQSQLKQRPQRSKHARSGSLLSLCAIKLAALLESSVLSTNDIGEVSTHPMTQVTHLTGGEIRAWVPCSGHTAGGGSWRWLFFLSLMSSASHHLTFQLLSKNVPVFSKLR